MPTNIAVTITANKPKIGIQIRPTIDDVPVKSAGLTPPIFEARVAFPNIKAPATPINPLITLAANIHVNAFELLSSGASLAICSKVATFG